MSFKETQPSFRSPRDHPREVGDRQLRWRVDLLAVAEESIRTVPQMLVAELPNRDDWGPQLTDLSFLSLPVSRSGQAKTISGWSRRSAI
jgi:hypothetical protein